MSMYAEKTAKRTYATPEVRIYGDLRSITQTTNNGGPVDDAPQKGNKTA